MLECRDFFSINSIRILWDFQTQLLGFVSSYSSRGGISVLNVYIYIVALILLYFISRSIQQSNLLNEALKDLQGFSFFKDKLDKILQTVSDKILLNSNSSLNFTEGESIVL